MEALTNMSAYERIYRVCVQCQRTFYIGEKDQEFFAEKDFPLPKKCWTCRRKLAKAREDALINQDNDAIDRMDRERIERNKQLLRTYKRVWSDDSSDGTDAPPVNSSSRFSAPSQRKRGQ